MKLDHIAVTQPAAYGLPGGQYQIRAELRDEPPSAWRMKFQAAWYNSPACRRLCSDVQMDGNSIYIRISDACHVSDTVTALKALMADIDEKPHAAVLLRKKDVI